MTPSDIYGTLLVRIRNSGLPFMITGSVATSAYGEPRMTNDVDVVIDLTADNAHKLLRQFASDDFYIPPIDILLAEAEEEGHFNVVHLDTAMRADFYVAGADPLHAWALANRRMEKVAGTELPFAPLEYVIVRKLEYFRDTKSDRHLRDVAGMMRISGARVDRAKLDSLIAERELGTQWEAAMGSGESRQ